MILGDILGGSGGGGDRLDGFIWTGVDLSDWRHWLIKGRMDDDGESDDFEDREWISLFDFERLRRHPSVLVGEASGGDVDFVRNNFCSFFPLFPYRSDEWNDDERVNNAFAVFNRSKPKTFQ